jgi:hypothetical protein
MPAPDFQSEPITHYSVESVEALAHLGGSKGHVNPVEVVVVRTGFYSVPDGRYWGLQPKSLWWVAFLPGDRVCVAEILPNGSANFHTIRRDELK